MHSTQVSWDYSLHSLGAFNRHTPGHSLPWLSFDCMGCKHRGSTLSYLQPLHGTDGAIREL